MAAPLTPTDVDLSTPGWNDPGPAPRVPLDIDALHASLFGALPTEGASPDEAVAGPGEVPPPLSEAGDRAVPAPPPPIERPEEATADGESVPLAAPEIAPRGAPDAAPERAPENAPESAPESAPAIEPATGTDSASASGDAEGASERGGDAGSPPAATTPAPAVAPDALDEELVGMHPAEESTPSRLPWDAASAAVMSQAGLQPASVEMAPPPTTNTLSPATWAAADGEPAAPAPPPDRDAHDEPTGETAVDDGRSSLPAPVDEPAVAPVAPGSSPTPDAVAEASGPASAEPVESAAAEAGMVAAEAQAPSFVRQAERAARWRSPRMRALLSAAALALCATAVLQAVGGFHDTIVERWPASRGVVQTLCGVAGCELQARRQLESLSVEGSSLVEIDGGDRVRLSLSLRNRARAERLLPSIELTLSDAQGATVARRVLTAAELGATAPTIAGGAELSLQAVLDVGGARVAGYALDLFYP